MFGLFGKKKLKFYGATYLIDKRKAKLVRHKNVAGEVEIYRYITKNRFYIAIDEIGKGAFKNRTSITSVKLTDEIRKIGASAFSGCTSLVKVDIPNFEVEFRYWPLCLAQIEPFTFSGCKALEEIVIPSTVLHIHSWAFKNCSSIKKIVLPEKLIIIEEGAFSGCKSLEKIIIPNEVSTISNGVFNDCPNLTIFCEVSEKPDGWVDGWNCSRPVVWGYEKQADTKATD